MKELCQLFTRDALHLVNALMEFQTIPKEMTTEFLKKSVHYLKSEEEIVYYISALEFAKEKFNVCYDDFSVDKIVDDTKEFILEQINMEYVIPNTVRKFLHEYEMDITDEQCDEIVCDAQRSLLHRHRSIDLTKIDAKELAKRFFKSSREEELAEEKSERSESEKSEETKQINM